MRWAGIGGLNTFLSHMKHFTRIGLIVRSFEIGDKEGAYYEVRLPEELDSTQLNSTQLDSAQLNSTSKRVHDSTQKLSRVELSNLIESKATSGEHQTSFKTKEENIDDDAALAGLIASLKSNSKEITGRELSLAESERWKELADVLMAELKIAAARTTVSSVPAFLAEHLRRRLWKIDKKQARAEGRELPDEVVTQKPSVDASKCTDCGGSGWWYPEGEGKGVAKCKHEKLATES
jgi:hypothetical protein